VPSGVKCQMASYMCTQETYTLCVEYTLCAHKKHIHCVLNRTS
jgi:hypothetical protein